MSNILKTVTDFLLPQRGTSNGEEQVTGTKSVKDGVNKNSLDVNLCNIDELIDRFLEKIMKRVRFDFEPGDFVNNETVFGPLPSMPVNGTIVEVYLNGALLKEGQGNDYQLSTDRMTINMEFAVKNTAGKPGRVTVFYVEAGI